jgi:feruloyl esterase
VNGTSTNLAGCLSAREAQVVNKIWYGLTRDGSHADPAVDNGGTTASLSSNHLWFGLTRGTNLTALAGTTPFAISSVQVALEMLDPSLAQSTPAGVLTNLAGANLGKDGWKNLSYSDLGRAFDQGLALQPAFSYINTDSVDLSALRDRGAKVISYHGYADQLIMPQGSLHYFERLAANMGGIAEVQKFNRLYFIPGHGHDGTFNSSASIDPTTGTNAATTKVPMPQSAVGRDELFTALRNWVEKSQPPGRIEVSSSNGSVSIPLCVHPQKAILTGTSPTSASSYTCQ